MVHVITTQPPRRHDSLMQKSSRPQFPTPPRPSPQAPFPTITHPQLRYLKPTTTSTWSPLDFSSFMTSSPTEMRHDDTPSPKWIDSTNKSLPSTPSYSAHKPSLTALPTRSSSLTNPVTQLSHTSAPSRLLPALPSYSEQTAVDGNDEDETCSYNAASGTTVPLSTERVDDDIETAMLHWKRTSTLTLSKTVYAPNDGETVEEKEDYDLFFTENKELWSSTSIFGEIETIAMKPSMQESCQQMADQLWKREETVVPEKDVAAFLGKSKLFNHTVLQLYLEKFDFDLQNLEHAFRCVCSKLYFKAEAQEIDRILQAFAHRYWYCNKHSELLYNADIVYAIVYSMLLLNTDLHIVHGSSHHRMSRSEFCENTMSTLMNNILAISEQRVTSSTWKHDMESYLKETYSSVKSKGILQPHSIDTPMRSSHKESSGVATATKSILQRMGSLKQPSTTSSPSPLPHRRKQHTDSGGTKAAPSTDYSHAKQDLGPGLEGRVRYKTKPNDSLRRRTTKSSSSSSAPSSSSPSNPSSSSGWHEAWLTLYHHLGHLRLEKLQSTSSRLIRQANQVSSWEIDLGHSTAAREAPVQQHHHTTATFHLSLGNGTLYEFECEDQHTATTWIHHLQLAAAMATHIPFMKPPISSDVYGWEPNFTQYDHIATWEPPAPPPLRISSSSTASSTSTSSSPSTPPLLPSFPSSHPFRYYPETTIRIQQKGIQHYLATLWEDHQQHYNCFSSISKIPTVHHTQKALIITNWHEKNRYLILEIEKYDLYGKALDVTPTADLPSLLLAIDNPIHSFDLFEEINHSLKHVSLE